jgi:hypothetical protein
MNRYLRGASGVDADAARSCHSLRAFRVPFIQVAGLLLELGAGCHAIRGSIVVSIPACHAGDPGSIPGSGAFCYLVFGSAMRGVCIDGVLAQCCWFLVAGSIIPCRAFLGRCPDADAAGKSCQWTKQKEEARCGARTRD